VERRRRSMDRLDRSLRRRPEQAAIAMKLTFEIDT
jgi:hypothetical protein